MFETLSPRVAIAVGLLALVPTLIFAFGRSGIGGLVASINVLVIVAALYFLLSPVEVRTHETSREQ